MTQADRLLRWLRANPGSSSLEITRSLDIVNVTGRVSDLRKRPGIDIDCRKRPDGRDGYWVSEGESGPGFARVTGSDSARQVERKIEAAFAPVVAMREAWERVFGGDS